MDSLAEVLVISGSEDKNANCCIYNLKNGSFVAKFEEGNSVKHGLCFLTDDYIISAFRKTPNLKIWSISQSKDSMKMTCPGQVSCLTVTKCGSYCIAGIVNYIYIWEVTTGNLLNTIQYHSKPVTVLRTSSDGSHFISGSGDGMVLVWSLSEVITQTEMSDNVKPRFTWMDHSAEVTDIFIGGIGFHARVATASRDMTCRLYELETGLLLFTVRIDYAVTAVVMDELEYFLILGTVEGPIYRINLFSVEEPELHYTKADMKSAFLGHVKEITCLSLSLSGKCLVSGSEDGDCRIWDMTNFSCVRRLNCGGIVTNAFISLYPPCLKDILAVYPKMHISSFQRDFKGSSSEEGETKRIQPRKLSLFHLGSPDEYFDSRILIDPRQPLNANENSLSSKYTTSVNREIFSFSLTDEVLLEKEVLESEPPSPQELLS